MRPEEAGPRVDEAPPGDAPPPPEGFDRPLRIGGVTLESRLLMAPMAGYTNLPFRSLVKARGAGMVATEMVSSQALARRHAKTYDLMRSEAAEKPVSIQLFGSDPVQMGEAAAMVEEAGADLVDLNCGCPVRKITKNRAGSALLRYPERAAAIVSAMARAVRVPVTVKMRTGWDAVEKDAAERFARAVEDAGARAITVHGRTRRAMFSGAVDLEAIARVKRAVSIPVIGNGSILSPQDAMMMIRRAGVDALMIGRGAIGNPWIFSRLLVWLRTGELPAPPGLMERKRMALLHFRRLREALGERLAALHCRKHLPAYTRGLRGGSALRERVNRESDVEAVLRQVEAFFDALASRPRAMEDGRGAHAA